MKIIRASLLSVVLVAQVACGYTLQHTQNPLLDRYGVRKIWVAPLVNNTYKPGVENLVYNELVKVIGANGRVILVDRTEDADAILSGQVTDASYSRSGSTTADALFPFSLQGRSFPAVKKPSNNIEVASEYSAVLSGSFSLSLKNPPKPGKKQQLWSGSFSRSQPFPANNQLGGFGTTSALINDSEFDRALRELAHSVMSNLHESMLAMF